MFVKLKNWNVKKGNDGTIIYQELTDESLHDVEKAFISPNTESGYDEEPITHMCLEMYSRGIRDIISFPIEQSNHVTEIYFMNSEGKTIDRYIY